MRIHRYRGLVISDLPERSRSSMAVKRASTCTAGVHAYTAAPATRSFEKESVMVANFFLGNVGGGIG